MTDIPFTQQRHPAFLAVAERRSATASFELRTRSLPSPGR
jgi:hypothetical protein